MFKTLIISIIFSIPLFVNGQTKGIASYYADKFAGRKTANGEIFSPEALTAAHKSLPFGTMVKVSCAKTGREVIVKINDRLPENSKRLIDLSPRAARELKMIRAGVIPVNLVILPE